jgi:hypothetical protein
MSLLSEVFPRRAADNLLNPDAVFEPYTEAIARVRQQADLPPSAVLDMSRYVFGRDSDRSESINDRAGTLLGATGLIATLIVFASPLVKGGIRGFTHQPVGIVALVAYALALGYLGWSATVCLAVQGGATRYDLGPDDLGPAQKYPQYELGIAAKILEYTSSNYKVNNIVMAKLAVAQKCFRNAVILTIIAGILHPFT